jgi:hypothetical protein
MLADEDLELRAKAARRYHQHSREQRCEGELYLQSVSPVSAEVADEISGAGDGEQENSGQKKRGGVKHRSTRHVHLDRPPGVPRGRNSEERNDQRIRNGARNPDIHVERPEQHRVGIEEKVEAEHAP